MRCKFMHKLDNCWHKKVPRLKPPSSLQTTSACENTWVTFWAFLTVDPQFLWQPQSITRDLRVRHSISYLSKAELTDHHTKSLVFNQSLTLPQHPRFLSPRSSLWSSFWVVCLHQRGWLVFMPALPSCCKRIRRSVLWAELPFYKGSK